MKQSGNTILITGGATGIGLAFAKAFVDAKNKVIITGRRQDKLDDAKAKVPGVVTVKGDVSTVEGVKALAAVIKSDHKDVNVVMNNAGIMVYKNLAKPEEDLAALTAEIDTNLHGPIRLNAALMEQIKSHKGTIINVSSGLAFVPLMAAPIYCATKAALHSYTISLRNQLKSSGVEVIEVAPPAVKTELADFAPSDGVKVISTDELIAHVMKSLASGDVEIRTGQANQLHWMSRIAPGFIGEQLAKGSAALVPN